METATCNQPFLDGTALDHRKRSSRCGAAETNLTRNHEVAGSTPGLAQWVKDLVLLWLWCRPAATAPIGPRAWKPPCATGAALKKTIIFLLPENVWRHCFRVLSLSDGFFPQRRLSKSVLFLLLKDNAAGHMLWVVFGLFFFFLHHL